MIFGYKLIMRPKRVRASTADLFSGKKEIDDQEAEFLAQQAAKDRSRGTKGRKIYRLFSWLF